MPVPEVGEHPGPPLRGSLLEVMQQEHCAAADSDDKFKTGNYLIETTPKVRPRPTADGVASPSRTPSPAERRLPHERRLSPV